MTTPCCPMMWDKDEGLVSLRSCGIVVLLRCPAVLQLNRSNRSEVAGLERDFRAGDETWGRESQTRHRASSGGRRGEGWRSGSPRGSVTATRLPHIWTGSIARGTSCPRRDPRTLARRKEAPPDRLRSPGKKLQIAPARPGRIFEGFVVERTGIAQSAQDPNDTHTNRPQVPSCLRFPPMHQKLLRAVVSRPRCLDKGEEAW